MAFMHHDTSRRAPFSAEQFVRSNPPLRPASVVGACPTPSFDIRCELFKPVAECERSARGANATRIKRVPQVRAEVGHAAAAAAGLGRVCGCVLWRCSACMAAHCLRRPASAIELTCELVYAVAAGKPSMDPGLKGKCIRDFPRVAKRTGVARPIFVANTYFDVAGEDSEYCIPLLDPMAIRWWRSCVHALPLRTIARFGDSGCWLGRAKKGLLTMADVDGDGIADWQQEGNRADPSRHAQYQNHGEPDKPHVTRGSPSPVGQHLYIGDPKYAQRLARASATPSSMTSTLRS